MTEEEFKKAMGKTIFFIVIALIVLVVIGVLVFNQSGKTASIFGSQKEADEYHQKVNEMNSYNITEEEASKLEGSSEFSGQEETQPELTGNTEEQSVPEENVESEVSY